MPSKIYLISGQTKYGRLKDINRKVISETKNGNVLVLNLSSMDNYKEKPIERIFKRYFNALGVNNLSFIESETPDKKIDEEITKAESIYLPGRNAKRLVKSLKERDLDLKLRNFNGVLFGNDVGAYALSDYILTEGKDMDFFPSLGLVGICIKTGYDFSMDEELSELSKMQEFYAIEDGSAIVSENEKLSFIGNVCRFNNGEKEGVN